MTLYERCLSKWAIELADANSDNVSSDFRLDEITRESYTELTSLVAKQVSLGPVKRATCTEFVTKFYSWVIKLATSLFD